MLAILTSIVNLASPPLRRALGRVKLGAQNTTQNTLNQCTTTVHMLAASADRWNQVIISGSSKKHGQIGQPQAHNGNTGQLQGALFRLFLVPGTQTAAYHWDHGRSS